MVLGNKLTVMFRFIANDKDEIMRGEIASLLRGL